MPYVDFDYYKDIFKGTVIQSSSVFESLEERASVYIDAITLGNIEEVDNHVKSAVCSVCEVYATTRASSGIKSESNDGYSVVYDDYMNFKKELYHSAKLYLPYWLLCGGA